MLKYQEQQPDLDRLCIMDFHLSCSGSHRRSVLGLVAWVVFGLGQLSVPRIEAQPLSYPRESAAHTAEAVALFLEHQDRCTLAAKTVLEVITNKAVDGAEARQSIESYNRSSGVGEYAAARWIYGALSKLLSDRDEHIARDVAPILREALELSGQLCDSCSSYPRGAESFEHNGESKLKAVTEAKAKLAVLAPLTAVKKETALAPYQREIDEVTQAALLEADPLGNRPRTIAEWEQAEADYKAWQEKRELERQAAEQAKTAAQKEREAERTERLRRSEERYGKQLAKGMKLSKKQKDDAPREQTQEYFENLEKRVAARKHHTQVRHWHQGYGEKILDLKKVLGLYLQPMKDGPSGYTCEALALRAGILLGDEELLGSPVPAFNEHLATGLRHFQAAGNACVKGDQAEAELQIQAATRALGAFGKELEKYGLAP